MIRRRLKGMGVALITPFNDDGSVDYQSLMRLVEYQIQNGADFLCILATTSEAPCLSKEEKQTIKDFIIDINAKRVPILMGCGGYNTKAVVEDLKTMDLTGVDGILSVCPYYNKPSQEGLFQHFRTVSEHSPLPVILYNIPGRTGVNMTAETTLRCARELPNVIGIKEASGNIEQMQQILDNRPEGFLVLSGDDGITIELMRRGGDGVISVAANAFPKRFMSCINHAKHGDFAAADREYEALDEAVKALFEEGNPVGVKCALAVMGLIGDTVRLPLVPGSEHLRERFKTLIAKYDLR